MGRPEKMYHQIVADGYKNGDEQPQVIGWGPCAPCCAYVSAQCRMWTICARAVAVVPYGPANRNLVSPHSTRDKH